MREIEVSSGSSGSSAARNSSDSSIRPVALIIRVVYGCGCTGNGSLPVFDWEREEICHRLGLTLRNLRDTQFDFWPKSRRTDIY
jgi:hypothetical protein